MGELEDAMHNHGDEQCIGCLEKECRQKLRDLISEFMDNENLTAVHILGIITAAQQEFASMVVNYDNSEDVEDIEEEDNE